MLDLLNLTTTNYVYIIDQLAILDLTGTDLIECMYSYTEIEALATYFDMDSSLREKSLNFCSAQRLYDSNAVQFGDKWIH
jgi:hypothetical protein